MWLMIICWERKAFNLVDTNGGHKGLSLAENSLSLPGSKLSHSKNLQNLLETFLNSSQEVLVFSFLKIYPIRHDLSVNGSIAIGGSPLANGKLPPYAKSYCPLWCPLGAATPAFIRLSEVHYPLATQKVVSEQLKEPSKRGTSRIPKRRFARGRPPTYRRDWSWYCREFLKYHLRR